DYAAAKRKLFERAELSSIVLNRDDSYGARWAVDFSRLRSPVPRLTVYGLDGELPRGPAYVIGRDLQLTPSGIRFTLDTSWGRAQLDSRLLGRFNAYNLMAAAAALLARGIALERVVSALAQSRTVPGRIEGFRGPKAKPLVVVDYAHTPDALRQILTALRAHTPGRLTCVFGCGGDRDRGKRPLMGAVAAELADAVIVTDDNPRGEKPESIIEDILAGIPRLTPHASRLTVIHDRAEAIRQAVATASERDVVVVAGKGHEQTQTYGTELRPFSDREFAAGLVGAAYTEQGA
ncbi:MAG: Mur ligase family protein, partial [Gammaproteobacteria bacterium]